MSDIIKWFRQDEQKAALRDEYQRQRLAIQDLRQVLHKDTSGSQYPERFMLSLTVNRLEQISCSDPQRFVETFIVATSKTITNMVCGVVSSEGKQSELMTREQITKAVNKLKTSGVSGPYNCVMSANDYGHLIGLLQYVIDDDHISDNERNEILHMLNTPIRAHGLRRGSWQGVGIYVTNRCTRSFVFGHGAIKYSERRDDLLITNFVVDNPREPLIDLGDLVLGLHRKPLALEVDVIGHYWPNVSIANKDAIVYI